VDYCGTGDGSQTQGGCSVLVGATESKRRYWDQPSVIRRKKRKKSLDGDAEKERPGG